MLSIVPFALLAQAGEQFLRRQPCFNPGAFNLARQCWHHRRHWRQNEYTIDIKNTKGFTLLDFVFLTQRIRERDYTSLPYLYCCIHYDLLGLYFLHMQLF